MKNWMLCLFLGFLISASWSGAFLASAEEIKVDSLSKEDQEILERGEITSGDYIAGGVTGTVLGLGIGHAFQGRYLDTGWIFTVGEVVSSAVLISGVSNCIFDSLITTTQSSCNSPTISIAYGALIGFRLWELIDVWATPPGLNDRYHQLKNRMGSGGKGVSFFLVPTSSSQVLTGLQVRF